jgi:YidC/Oxa1 family membrane protein insertase
VIDAVLGFLGRILSISYDVIPSYGVAIIVLTIMVRLVVFPLTAKGAKSMIQMQRVQPEIKKLQAKYKNDRASLNEETMKFYKENDISPFGGCLPLLMQFPVLIALFSVLHNAQKYIPKGSTLYKHLVVPVGAANFHQLCDTAGKVATKACTNPHTLQFLGMNLSKTPTNFGGSAVDGIPYYLMVALMVVTGFVQQQQNTRVQSNVNQQMQTVMKVMPILFAVWSLFFPAGIVIYWVATNFFIIAQQEWIYRTYGKSAMATPFVPVRAIDSKDVPAASTVVEKPKGFRAALREAREQGSTPSKAGGAGKSAPVDKRSGNPARRPTPARATPPTPSAKSTSKTNPKTAAKANGSPTPAKTNGKESADADGRAKRKRRR